MNILAWAGYWAGLGVELAIIVIAGVLLVLMLTGVLFKWIAAIKEWIARKKEENEQKKAEKAARAEAEAAARAEAEAQAAEEAAAELEEETEEEITEEEVVEEEVVEETEEEAEVEEEPVEEELVEEEEEKPKSKKKSKKSDDEEDETEVVVVQEGIVFNESKTITELYDELTAEQKGYFDELREAALSKPDTELAMSKNFVTVKIGKRNLIKLLIKRGVTVAEFLIENEALKALRLSNTNKRGKSTIKVKPTVVHVLDVGSLQVAIDMVNLAYEEIVTTD